MGTESERERDQPTAIRTVYGEGDGLSAEGNDERRQFRIERCLGRGGFGEVYLATMRSPGGVKSRVAVKVLREGVDPRAQAVQRLKDEARVLGSLEHPSILSARDLVVLDGRVAMVTEYVPGGDLDVCLDGDDPPSLRAILEVLAAAADALSAAWNARDHDGTPLHLIHWDIKPSNLRLGHHGQVKVLDFGIARFSSSREAKTQVNQMIGTMSYMAPERMADGVMHPNGDVYAIGAILYEVLAGELLWADVSHREQFRYAMLAEDHADFVANRLEGVDGPEDLLALLRRTLDADPEARPSARELALELESIGDALPGKNLRRWCRDHAWPEPATFDAELVGRTLTEGRGLGSSASLVDAPSIVDSPPSNAPGSVETAVQEPPAESGSMTEAWYADGEFDRLEADDTDEVVAARPPLSALVAAGAVFFLLVTGASAAVALQFAGSDPGEEPDTLAPVEPPTPPVAPEVPEELPSEPVGEPTVPNPLVEAESREEAGAPPARVAEGRELDDEHAVVEPAGEGAPEAVDPVDSAPEPPGDGDERIDDEGTDASELEATEDAVAMVAEVAPTPETEPRGEGCDPSGLEARARVAGLTPAERTCLTDIARDGSQPLTTRRAHASVALADALATCQTSGSCEDFERRQRYFLSELGAYDPLMMLTWSRHLYDTAGGRSSRYREAYSWAGRAMERSTDWTGLARTTRVRQLLRVRAFAAVKLLQASPTDANREVARDATVAWAELLRSLNLDATEALDLCASATGNAVSLWQTGDHRGHPGVHHPPLAPAARDGGDRREALWLHAGHGAAAARGPYRRPPARRRGGHPGDPGRRG